MKTSDLQGAALDWAVAKCEGVETRNNKVVYFVPHEAESDDELEFVCSADDDAHAIEQCENAYPNCTVDRVEWTTRYEPSTDWAQGGPIIEREKISTSTDERGGWMAWIYDGLEMCYLEHGPNPLIAVMRCYVASKLGDEVNIPEELK